MPDYAKKLVRQQTAILARQTTQLVNRGTGASLADHRQKTGAQLVNAELIDHRRPAVQRKAQANGLPRQLKAGIEALSGMPMDHVKVHYNSAKPAQLQALAYAQGSDIHLASGQEKHLPHEAWHLVQQAQGRVKPTMQMKGTAINDNRGLETEADVMGAKALQMQTKHSQACGCPSCTGSSSSQSLLQKKAIAQRYCGAKGCQDPNCHDPKNHSMTHVRELRNVDIYNASRDKSSLGKGSDTNKKTRDYVQDPNSFYPEEVSLSYRNEDGSITGGSSYVQPPRTPGMKPDAGHIFGNQYGGSGTDTANIFAQEPKHNRGNSYNGQKTFGKWRRTENEIRKGIQKGHRMDVQAKLYRKKRRKYDPSTVSDEAYREFMKKWYYSRRDDDHDKGGGGGITT